MRSATVAAAVLAAVACVPDEGPLMSPHQDCLGCHGRGEGPTWTVAGTFGGKGSHVTITDANGWSFALRAAENGNFYTAERVTFPITVSVDGTPMADDGGILPVEYGGCNLCHGPGGVLLALDEFMAPGQDCIACHSEAGMAKKVFSAAGTWSREGAVVRLTDGARSDAVTTNRVGNFFSEVPFRLPLTTSVDGQAMEPPVTYGGCNVCHPFGRDADD